MVFLCSYDSFQVTLSYETQLKLKDLLLCLGESEIAIEK